MALKFHVNNAGEPGVCRAVSRNGCPFGGINEHYDSREKARKAYEKHMNNKVFTTRKPVRKNNNEFFDDDVFNSKDDSSVDYTPIEAKKKFDREIRGNIYELETMNGGEPGLKLEELFGKTPDSDPGADLGTTELKTVKSSSTWRHMSLGALHMNDMEKFREKYVKNTRMSKFVSANGWTEANNHFFALFVDRESRKVNIIVADSKKDIVSAGEFYWTFDDLENKVTSKFENIAVALYDIEEKTDGKRTVRYNDLLTGGFTKEEFIDKLESGEVKMNFRVDDRYRRTTIAAKPETFIPDFNVKEVEKQ